MPKTRQEWKILLLRIFEVCLADALASLAIGSNAKEAAIHLAIATGWVIRGFLQDTRRQLGDRKDLAYKR